MPATSGGVQPRLTLTYGARLDVVRYPDKPNREPRGRGRLRVRHRRGAEQHVLFSPRAGFNYALHSDGTEQVRGGIGLFSGRTPYVWISNQYGNTGVDFTRINAAINATQR